MATKLADHFHKVVEAPFVEIKGKPRVGVFVMIDNVAGQGYVGVNADQLKLTGDAVESEELGFIFSKGSPLVAPIDATLQAMMDDGTLDELFTTWFETEE